jgi:endonuclease/exonuclease/phosphatase family metal-dependent hydrolase
MRIRIVTYNIHRAIGVDRRFRPERITSILGHYGADIVLLQEVDEGVPRSRELNLARELAGALRYPHYAVGHNVSLRRGRYGNATLSRYPIFRERNIDLTVDNHKRRGCQHTSIVVERVSGRSHCLEVFNLHLGLSARERLRQVGKLVRSAEFREMGENGACLVGGDFNDWRSQLHPVFTELLGFRCATDRLEGPIRTYPSFSPTGGLDRIYYRGELRSLGTARCRLRVSKLASDHLPVIAEFELCS